MFFVGDLVREHDGRHEGDVIAAWQNTVRVKWRETGWKQDFEATELILIAHQPTVRKIGQWYVAWTPTWEGPARPDYMAASADLLDRLDKESLL